MSNVTGRGVTIKVTKAGAGGSDDEDPIDSKLAEMLEAMGGEGKIKLFYRRPIDGEEEHVGTFQVEDSMLDDIEGYVGRTYGGGTYRLKGTHRGKYVGSSVVILCSERQYGPPRDRFRELNGEAPGKTAQPADAGGSAELKILQLRMEMESRSRAETQQMMTAMLQIQENASQRLTQVFMAQGGRGADGAGAGSLDNVMSMAKLFKEIGWGPNNGGGGDGGGPDPSQNPAMALLSSGLNTLVGKIGEKVGSAIEKQMAPTPPAPPPVPRIPKIDLSPPAVPRMAAPPVSPIAPPAAAVAPAAPTPRKIPVPGASNLAPFHTLSRVDGDAALIKDKVKLPPGVKLVDSIPPPRPRPDVPHVVPDVRSVRPAPIVGLTVPSAVTE